MNIGKELAEVAASCVVSAVNKAMTTAKFDKSSIGVVRDIDENSYTVLAFGGQYTINSNLKFSKGQKVAVVAPQGNFNKLYMIAI